MEKNHELSFVPVNEKIILHVFFSYFCTMAKTTTKKKSAKPIHNSSSIESNLSEKRLFKPSKQFAAKARISSMGKPSSGLSSYSLFPKFFGEFGLFAFFGHFSDELIHREMPPPAVVFVAHFPHPFDCVKFLLLLFHKSILSDCEFRSSHTLREY